MTSLLLLSPARQFLTSISGWGQTQVTLSVLDNLITWGIYSRVKGPAIFLLAILSTLKLSVIIWLCLGADYTSDYTDSLVGTIIVGLDVAWFINDHIASLSTLQKLIYLPQSQWRKISCIAVMAISVSFGLFLRIDRSACRFGDCLFMTPVMADSTIAINVLTTELILIAFLIGFFYEMYLASDQKNVIVSEMIQQGALRIAILVPLGVLETTAYIVDNIQNSRATGTPPIFPNALIWLLEIGIYARHTYPTLLSIAIALTRVRIGNSSDHTNTGPATITAATVEHPHQQRKGKYYQSNHILEDDRRSSDEHARKYA